RPSACCAIGPHMTPWRAHTIRTATAARACASWASCTIPWRRSTRHERHEAADAARSRSGPGLPRPARAAYRACCSAAEGGRRRKGPEDAMIAEDVELAPDVVVFPPDLVNLYGCRIGGGTKIGSFVEIQRGAAVGANCKISSHSFICEGVTIEDGVFVGHGVM